MSNRELGLGVVNPRADDVESVAAIVAKVEEALKFYRPNQLFLNNHCGFVCFAGRSVNIKAIAFRKLCAIV